MHHNLALYLLNVFQLFSICFIVKRMTEVEILKHTPSNICFFLGMEWLGQTVCMFKIPIHVIKQSL